jgi:hypothetical protein
MTSAYELRKRAMEIKNRGDNAVHQTDASQAQDHYYEAYLLAREAALKMTTQKNISKPRAIFFSEAVDLAVKSNSLPEVPSLVAAAFVDANFPADKKQELQDALKYAQDKTIAKTILFYPSVKERELYALETTLKIHGEKRKKLKEKQPDSYLAYKEVNFFALQRQGLRLLRSAVHQGGALQDAYKKAVDLTIQAALQLEDKKYSGFPRTTLFKNAAVCAFNSGRYEDVKTLIALAAQGKIGDEAFQEFANLLQDADNEIEKFERQRAYVNRNIQHAEAKHTEAPEIAA